MLQADLAVARGRTGCRDFDDEEARAAAFASEHGQKVAADAAAHASERVHLVTTEYRQLMT